MLWAPSWARDESARTVTTRKHKIALCKPHLDRDDETKCDELREQAKAGSGVDAMREGIEARRGEACRPVVHRKAAVACTSCLLAPQEPKPVRSETPTRHGVAQGAVQRIPAQWPNRVPPCSTCNLRGPARGLAEPVRDSHRTPGAAAQVWPTLARAPWQPPP